MPGHGIWVAGRKVGNIRDNTALANLRIAEGKRKR